MGDSRYVVEPNVKDGKGGLRDLHTLYWIGQYVFGVERPAELVDKGLFSAAEFRRFERAERFFLVGAVHLHLIAGRAEERLGSTCSGRSPSRCATPTARASRRSSASCNSISCNAKAVGDLTGLFLAQLDEQMGDKGAASRFRPCAGGPKHFGASSSTAAGCRSADGCFPTIRSPARAVRAAAREGWKSIPTRCARRRRDARLVDQVATIRGQRLVPGCADGRDKPDVALRWMNEAGVFGRFVPDFGRSSRRCSSTCIHHYTVDEHSIRAIWPVVADRRWVSWPTIIRCLPPFPPDRVRRVPLCRRSAARHRQGPLVGDHSEIGAEIALQLCPPLRPRRGETETVSWLVRHPSVAQQHGLPARLGRPKTSRIRPGVQSRNGFGCARS
jgi:[protein-PII] uridylyltransferase